MEFLLHQVYQLRERVAYPLPLACQVQMVKIPPTTLSLSSVEQAFQHLQLVVLQNSETASMTMQ